MNGAILGSVPTDVQQLPVGELVPFRAQIPGAEVFYLSSETLTTSAEVIILIHGAVASRRYLIPTARLLAKDFRVLVPDLPGHGASSKPEHAFDVSQQADAIKNFMDVLAIPKAHFFANSYGCQILAQFAVRYPESVDQLFFSDPTGDPAAHSLWKRFYRLCLDGLVEPPFAPFQMFIDIYDMGIRRTFETANHMKNDDIREKLPKIKANSLVIRGANDFIAPQAWCEEVATLLPNSRLVVIPNAPHSVNSAAAPQLTQIMRSFLAEARTDKAACNNYDPHASETSVTHMDTSTADEPSAMALSDETAIL